MAAQWNNRSMDIDQLWYTWSTVGLSSVTTGFRIRAASGSLAEVASLRVQNLDQYLRYDLPDGADRFDPTNAPHSLALLQTSDGERVLINKIYQGRDGVGRPGAFFAHLLAPLPSDFTPQDAFLLWRSGFWHSSDAGMGNNLYLNATSLAELRSQEVSHTQLDVFQLPFVDSEKLRTFLPYFISAYLMWRTEWEAWKKKGGQGRPPKHLYIAAPADMVAAFLLALTLCLPDALLTGLTFSTYEKDVQAAGQTMMIVGTTMTDEMLSMKSDLPAPCYINDIALNCYSPDRYTPLDQYPLGSLAFAVAKNITNKLAKSAEREKLRKFRIRTKFIQNPQSVGVEQFLDLYDAVYLKERKSDKVTFEYYLAHPDAAAEYLGDSRIAEYAIKLASTDISWGTNGLPRGLELLTAYSNREHDEDLAQALFDIAKLAADEFATIVEQGKQFLALPAMTEIMDAVSALMLRNNSTPWYEIWNTPLYALENKSEQRMLSFFLSDLNVYFKFLQKWNFSLPQDKYYLLNDLLQVPWQQSERFFALKIPSEWKLTALKADSIPLAKIQQPGQQFFAVSKLALQACLDRREWFLAEDFYRMFKEAPAYYKQELLRLLLNSPLSINQEQGLITTPEDRVWFLQIYGQKYLPEQRIASISTQFAMLNDFEKKFAVLHTWLKPRGPGGDVRSREFVAWLESPMNWQSMETVLEIAQLQSSDEIATFFEEYGSYYLQRYGQPYIALPSTVMSGLLRRYLADLDEATLRSYPSAQDFVTALSIHAPYLPSDIRSTLVTLTRFDNVFKQDMDCIELVIAIAQMLMQQPAFRPALYKKLAERFIKEIADETYLSEVIGTMQISSDAFTLYDLFQVLLKMAESVRDDVAQQPRPFVKEQVVLYVNFVLFADLIFVKPNLQTTTTCEQMDYAIFQKSFLDRLLEGVDSNFQKELEHQLHGKSKEGLHAYGAKSPINMRHYSQPSLVATSDNGSANTPHTQTRSKKLSTVFLNATDCVELVESLGRLLRQQQIASRKTLRTKLANTLFEQITNETYLAEVIRTMKAPFTLDDVFQILLMMAQLVREEITEQSTPFPFEHVALYMNFIYHADVILVEAKKQGAITCTKAIYALFQKSFLDRLLEGVDSRTLDNTTFKELEQALTGRARGKLAYLGYNKQNLPYPRELPINTSTSKTNGRDLGLSIGPPRFSMPQGIKLPTLMGGKQDVPSPTQQDTSGFFDAPSQTPKRKTFLSKVMDMLDKIFNKIVDMVVGSKKTKSLPKPNEPKR